jgi:hypothetical protein
VARTAKAAEDVATANHYPDLHTSGVDLSQFCSRGTQRFGVNAEAAFSAAQRFAAEFQEHALIAELS